MGGERRQQSALSKRVWLFQQKPISLPNHSLPSSIYWLRLGCLEPIKDLIVEIFEDWVL